MPAVATTPPLDVVVLVRSGSLEHNESSISLSDLDSCQDDGMVRDSWSPSLTEYVLEYGHNKYDWYFPVFDAALDGHTVHCLLEIGNSAQSLQMWLDCFPEAEITGLDIDGHGPTGQDDHHAMAAANDRLTFIQGDQANLHVLHHLGAFDVIVDDGGHHSYQQITTFTELFPKMPSGGWYFIEDLHCSYVEMYQDDGPTAIGFLKGLLDDLNARYFPTPRQQRWPIAELRLVDSLAAIRRQ